MRSFKRMVIAHILPNRTRTSVFQSEAAQGAINNTNIAAGSHLISQRRWSSSTQTVQSSLGPNFTKSQAVKMIEKLTVDERKLFLKELKKVVQMKEKESNAKPTRGELKQLAY